VLDAYEKTQEEEPASEAYERSELLLYKASVLAEGGKAADALALLDGNQVQSHIGSVQKLLWVCRTNGVDWLDGTSARVLSLRASNVVWGT
jgi:hypothetical protein